ncbi:hypothetical protein PybrP1_010239, partial [[Pythium] brassicae (nom. inval.)]
MLMKQVPRPLDGVATKNYFQELQSISVSFDSFDATVKTKFGIRHQIVPTNVKIPEPLKTSAEAVFFVEKHHTKIRKATKAAPVIEVAEAMANDENTALLNTLPDRLEEADKKVERVVKIFENTANPDHVLKAAVESAQAFNSALSLK